MPDHIRRTKPQLQRTVALKKSGIVNQKVFQMLGQEFGVLHYIAELNAEQHFPKKDTQPIPLSPSLVPLCYWEFATGSMPEI